MAVLLAISMAVVAVLSAVSLAFTWVTWRHMQKLLDTFRKGHGEEPCPDPSGAAVVTPSPSPAHTTGGELAPAPAARDAVAAATGSAPPFSHKPPTPIASRRAIRLGVPPERTVPDHRARPGSSPTLVSAGITPPPSSEPRMMPLDQIAHLDEADLALVDAAAARHGITREAMLAILVDRGATELEARALTPTMPPGRPANDGHGPMLPAPIPHAPPALSVRAERRWHELLASAQARGEAAEHCMGSACLRDGVTAGACPCECEGCGLVKDLLAQAKRESRRE